jgi:hypothetical protein
MIDTLKLSKGLQKAGMTGRRVLQPRTSKDEGGE